MSIRKIRITEAAKRAKVLLENLREAFPDTPQWDLEVISNNIKDTYKALQEFSKSEQDKDITRIEKCLSIDGLNQIKGISKKTINDKWHPVLECFKYQLEDIAIIGIVNFPGKSDDRIIVWLDHEKVSKRANDLDTDKVNELEDFNFLDSFKLAGGLKPLNVVQHFIFMILIDPIINPLIKLLNSLFEKCKLKWLLPLLDLDPISLAGTNDTWTFIWDGERQKWVLDFLGNDQFADMFTKTIGNSINYEGHEFKYPKLI